MKCGGAKEIGRQEQVGETWEGGREKESDGLTRGSQGWGPQSAAATDG